MLPIQSGLSELNSLKREEGGTVVYTACYGDYDTVLPPVVFDPDISYLLFTDSPAEIEGWTTVVAPAIFPKDARLSAKIYKICSSLLFPNASCTFWHDANLVLLPELVRRQHSFKGLLLFKHPHRDCLFEEAKECINLNKDSEDNIIRQVKEYRGNIAPSSGLYAAMMIGRNMSCNYLKEFELSWWEEILKFSIRDQISLPYVLKKVSIPITVIYEDPFYSTLLKYMVHKETK